MPRRFIHREITSAKCLLIVLSIRLTTAESPIKTGVVSGMKVFFRSFRETTWELGGFYRLSDPFAFYDLLAKLPGFWLVSRIGHSCPPVLVGQICEQLCAQLPDQLLP